MSESPDFFLAPPPHLQSSTSSSSAVSRNPTASLRSESPPDLLQHYADNDLNASISPAALVNNDDPPTSLPESAATSADKSQPSEKPFHSKRPHKKSRAGCKNCKARKVKCDEARPTCRSCRLRKTECIYPDPGSTIVSSSSSSSSSKETTSSSTVRAIHKATVHHAAVVDSTPGTISPSPFALPYHHQSPQQTTLTASIFTDPVQSSFDDSDTLLLHPPPAQDESNIDPTYNITTPLMIVSEPVFKPLPAIDDTEVKLMWWYTSQTSASFSLSPDLNLVTPGVRVMRTSLVHHAFRQPFLMDTIYALTALHLTELDPSGNTIDPKKAVFYRQRSYIGYRKAIETADPETYPALLSNSLLLCALSSQTFREQDAPDLYIIDWMVVWKGIGLIVDLVSVSGLVASGLQALFYRPQLDLDEAATSVPNHLLFMISSIPDHDPDYADRDAYYGCLKHLGSLFSNLRTGGICPIMGLRIVTTFTFVPSRFVELARLRRPRALVILAYYAMFFKLIPIVWWTVGIGQRSLRDICKHLGPDWHHLLRSPMMAIHVSDPLAVSRIILEDPTWNPPQDEVSSHQWEKQVRELSWVDNAGRKMFLQPQQNRMVARESPDGPDMVPYFDDNCKKGGEHVDEKYKMGCGVLDANRVRQEEELQQI